MEHFYTERFYERDNGEPALSVVYDCGSRSTSVLHREIDGVFNAEDNIDLLFISHFHSDHINGIEYLLNTKHCVINRFVIPVITQDVIIESYLHNYIKTKDIHCPANQILKQFYVGEYDDRLIKVYTFDEFINGQEITFTNRNINEIIQTNGVENVVTPTIIEKDNWLYIPYNVNTKRNELIRKISNHPDFQGIVVGGGIIDTDRLSEKLSILGLDRCTDIYEDIFGKHNIYSMPVFSGIDCCSIGKCYKECHKQGNFPSFCHTNCLYMGDYDAKDQNNYDALVKFFEHYWDRIGLIQVPHHGSKYNSDMKLYKPKKFCIISAKSGSRTHPDQMTINSIRSMGSIHTIVTEDKRTEQKFIYQLKNCTE